MAQPEVYRGRFEGHKVTSVLDHDTATDILTVAGYAAPPIPPDCNTVLFRFVTADGKAALAVNQTEFAPQATDNECSVNGCSVYIAQELQPAEEAWAVLERFVGSWLESKEC